jgi:capsular polysaccharide biosynthesis protein
LKKLFLSTYNIKTTTPSFFIDCFQQYSEELQASKGLTFGNASKFNALNKSINDLQVLLIPSKHQIKQLQNKMGRLGSHLYRNTQATKEETTDILEAVYNSLPTEEQLQKLSSYNPENSKLLGQILNATAQYPSRDEIKEVINSNRSDVVQKLEDMLSGVTQ